MLNIPLLKFEKNTTYLKNQLDIQENNKQLILDIIANIGLILNTSSNKNKENFETVLESANEFLQNISTNITIIEQLNLEISNITKELTEVLSEQNKVSKTKEFYIASFSNIKHNMSQYIEKFQAIEKKLETDNNNFNEFININNFKYNFESIETSEKSNLNTYEFTGFSINDQEISSKSSNIQENDSVDELIINKENLDENIDSSKRIDELTNNFKELLTGLSTGNKEVKDVFDFVKTSLEVETYDLEDVSPKENLQENTLLTSSEVIISNDSFNTENHFDDITEEILEDELLSALIENTEIEDSIQNLESSISEEKNEYLENTLVEKIEDIDFSVDMDKISSTPIKKKKIKYSGDAISDYAKNLYSPNISMEDYISNEYDLFEITDPKYKIEKKKEEPLLPKLGNIQKEIISSNLNFTKEIDNEVLEEILDSNDSLNLENIEEPVDDVVIKDLDIEENSEPSPLLKQSIDIFDDIDEYEETIIEDEEYDEEYDEECSYFENSTSVSDNEKNLDNLSQNFESEIEEDLSIPEKIKKILEASSDNETLIISENTNKAYLPYKISELLKYVEAYPDVYTSLSDVVEQEFILPFDYFIKHPYKSRFFETYNLIRNRAGYPVLTALKFGFKLIYKTNLNPIIIAACKTQTELKSLLYHLDADNLREFKYFNIVFDVNPFIEN